MVGNYVFSKGFLITKPSLFLKYHEELRKGGSCGSSWILWIFMDLMIFTDLMDLADLVDLEHDKVYVQDPMDLRECCTLFMSKIHHTDLHGSSRKMPL